MLGEDRVDPSKGVGYFVFSLVVLLSLCVVYVLYRNKGWLVKKLGLESFLRDATSAFQFQNSDSNSHPTTSITLFPEKEAKAEEKLETKQPVELKGSGKRTKFQGITLGGNDFVITDQSGDDAGEDDGDILSLDA